MHKAGLHYCDKQCTQGTQQGGKMSVLLLNNRQLTFSYVYFLKNPDRSFLESRECVHLMLLQNTRNTYSSFS